MNARPDTRTAAQMWEALAEWKRAHVLLSADEVDFAALLAARGEDEVRRMCRAMEAQSVPTPEREAQAARDAADPEPLLAAFRAALEAARVPPPDLGPALDALEAAGTRLVEKAAAMAVEAQLFADALQRARGVGRG